METQYNPQDNYQAMPQATGNDLSVLTQTPHAEAMAQKSRISPATALKHTFLAMTAAAIMTGATGCGNESPDFKLDNGYELAAYSNGVAIYYAPDGTGMQINIEGRSNKKDQEFHLAINPTADSLDVDPNNITLEKYVCGKRTFERNSGSLVQEAKVQAMQNLVNRDFQRYLVMVKTNIQRNH